MPIKFGCPSAVRGGRNAGVGVCPISGRTEAQSTTAKPIVRSQNDDLVFISRSSGGLYCFGGKRPAGTASGFCVNMFIMGFGASKVLPSLASRFTPDAHILVEPFLAAKPLT